LYIPEAFREADPARLHAFIVEHGFATLVSTGPDGMIATHLPLLLDPDRGPNGTLIGHLARANPHGEVLAAGGEALAIFHGPHAYVSPQWYTTPMAVPTWNYAVVHAYGRPRIVDEVALRGILARTVATFEAAFDYPWTPPPGDFVDKLAKQVVGFEMEMERLEGKLKLSQNRSQADQQGTIAGLRATGERGALGVAEMMARRG
jgi:transcriptional regulator